MRTALGFGRRARIGPAPLAWRMHMQVFAALGFTFGLMGMCFGAVALSRVRNLERLIAQRRDAG